VLAGAAAGAESLLGELLVSDEPASVLALSDAVVFVASLALVLELSDFPFCA